MDSFVKDFASTRNKIINPTNVEMTYINLKDLKDSMISYLNMLNFLKTKINFGNDQYSLKIEFIWRDTIKDSNISSYNLAYEIYCVLYNLAICNNLMAKLVNPDADDELKLKESIKQLEFCAGITDKIKSELPGLIAEKEIPVDLSANYMQFVILTYILFIQIKLINGFTVLLLNIK